ncbi:MAG: helix-turn-helix transcriptional regulator [Lachnospiraceae bacterium]|nr:helix-turn-helix transcriptional regulator [Lachnospiraceae bacterium]
MELSNQIKKYRAAMNLSQEDLAEKIYVTRQTISNWENGKSYPDVHSLLLLSSCFRVSLDQLIKGDIAMMKEKINKEELRKFNKDGFRFALLLILFALSAVPLTMAFHYYGMAIAGLIYGIRMYYAVKLEKFKKKYDVQTFKEIIALTEGKKLDELEKARECGKRPYQNGLKVCAGIFLSFAGGFLTVWLFKHFPF